MQRKLQAISIALICVLQYSCQKVNNIDKRSFTYSIDGMRNVSLPANYSTMLVLDARLLTGDPTDKYFTLTVDGLPQNVTVDSAVSRFRLNYKPVINFFAHDALQGVYPVHLTTWINKELQRVDTINLVVGPPKSLISWLCKNYYYDVTSSCGGGIYASIDSVPAVLNRVKISIENLMNIGQLPDDFINTYADVNAMDSTFVVPLQEVRGDSLRGKGYYYLYNGYQLRMHIDDTLISNAQVINTCSLELRYTN